jgi:hypothetical protein
MSDAQILIPRELLKVWLAFGDEVPMAPSTRRYMEKRFGADLTDVRIHTGAVAAQLCDSLNCRALTLDNDILFAEGEYEPASSEGKWLLAHELAHVLQQRAGQQTASRRQGGFIALGTEDDACEAEADRMAAEVLDGGRRSHVTADRSGAIRGTRRPAAAAEAQVPQKVCRTTSSGRGGAA